MIELLLFVLFVFAVARYVRGVNQTRLDGGDLDNLVKLRACAIAIANPNPQISTEAALGFGALCLQVERELRERPSGYKTELLAECMRLRVVNLQVRERQMREFEQQLDKL